MNRLHPLTESFAALAQEVAQTREMIDTLRAEIESAQRRSRELLLAATADAATRAAMAALPRAKLLSESLSLSGRATQRLRVRRVTVGEPVERQFSRWIGLTRCVSEDREIATLWERLLAFEASCDDTLRAAPTTVLDVPGATVSRRENGGLRIDLRAAGSPNGAATHAIPRFTHDFYSAKLDNFGHWLIDCAPQVVALSTLDANARFLLPGPLKRFQRNVLSLVGITERQMIAWDGAPLECDRLLILESDGRIGGGRPLSSLMQLRRLVAPPARGPAGRRARRIYVSRRDALAKGAWISNEPDVEDVFRSRGFEIVVMAECPLEEQARLFREAAIVAGVSGAGLSDIVFSPSGIDVIVLLSDSLIRWYSHPDRGRSKWTSGPRARREHLSALGDSPRFWPHVAAACEQVSHSLVSGDRVPVDHLATFVDEVLARVGAQ